MKTDNIYFENTNFDCEALTENRDFLCFKDLTEESMIEIAPYLNREASRTTDFSYGGVIMWTRYFHYKYDIIKDTLFMMGDTPAVEGYCFTIPIGKLSPSESIPYLVAYCKENNIQLSIMSTEYYLGSLQVATAALGVGSDSLNIVPLQDWNEYIYNLDAFVTFSGKKLNKKRNHLNAFLNTYTGHLVNRIGKEDIEDIIKFTNEFHERHDDSEMSNYETEETLRVLRNYEDYPFIGLVIRNEGNVIGYTIGEVIGDTLFTHVEKGDIAYRGIYQALCYYFSRYIKALHPELKYVNREEDVGDESLRKSKMSYHPEFFVEKMLINF